MGFTDRQIRQLSRRVPARYVKSRLRDGKELSYIEGWYALDQANRIFGVHCWDRETIEMRCVHTHQERTGATVAIYAARVRVRVRAQDDPVVREGHGTGEARANSLAEAHDRALKAAETDATKRVLATFGRAFGLALYAGLKQQQPLTVSPPVRMASDPNPRPSLSSHLIEELAGPSNPQSETHAEKPNQLPTPPSPPPEATRTTGGLKRLLIDKSALTFSEPKRLRDRDHLRFVASQPCLLCGKTPTDAHHIGFAQPRALARKVSDEFTVPLCRDHHAELHHEGNEVAWWHDMGVEPLAIARDLWADSQKIAQTGNGGTAK